MLCTAPSYLKTYGMPATPVDLIQHNCLRYLFNGQRLSWEFLIDGVWQTVRVSGSFNSDNGGALKNAALAGLGITRLLGFQVREEIKTQQLIALFPEQLPSGLIVQAVFTHQRHLSPRVQVFLEFLTKYCASFQLA
ncbi:substrate binding domain-containing protein [Gloeocapsa sp. PCC 7428]|uniref:substrate binding domain-containing protein n=1 Tax=Gloeocapsa sp. PCC 7428 TaxID=1173026 RepID=UPI0009005769|nr:substrate binding domain-containing protein [Gloeocapsa sp. PCC 7428]